MSSNKVQMIVVDSGELYVFGKLISRHPEMPWLFSITDVYKACEKPIKKEAIRKGKKPDIFFKTRAPGQWLRTKDEGGVKLSALATRKRLLKHGISCGFGPESTVRRRTVSLVINLTDRELCIKSVEGNTKLRGTYVCQNWIVQYAAFLNEALSEEITNTFISVLNGYTEEVTNMVEKNERIAKGTQARADNIQLNNRLVEVCGMKNILPMKVQEGINEGTFGMTATKLKKTRGIKEPFNDNITETEAAVKNIAIILATTAIRTHPAVFLKHREGRVIGVDSGVKANETVKSHLTKYSAV